MDGLVTDNQLLQVIGFTPRDCNVYICNVELVFILEEKVGVIRIIFIKSDDEHTKLVLILVSYQVEALVLMVIDDLLDVTDLVCIIQVKESLCLLLTVIQHRIIERRHDVHRLILIYTEEFRLLRKCHVEFDNIEHLFLVNIEDNNRVLLGKDDLVWLLVSFGILEEESHRNLIKLLDFRHVYGLDVLEKIHLRWVLILGSLVQVQFAWLLLVHDKILSTDNGKHFLAS